MDDFDPEMYVYYGTNEYNHEKLKDPPKFKPTRCAECGRIIDRVNEGHSMRGDKFYCINCTDYFHETRKERHE